jgi:hypothetical protein
MRGFLAPAAPCSSAWPLPPAKPRTSEACARRGSRWSSLAASTRTCRDDLTRRSVRLNLGGSVYDPTDSVGRLLFNVLDLVAEFEADLIRARTCEGMAVGSGSTTGQRSVDRPPIRNGQGAGEPSRIVGRSPKTGRRYRLTWRSTTTRQPRARASTRARAGAAVLRVRIVGHLF